VQKVPDTPQNMAACICDGCPSYPGEGTLYCARGESDPPPRRRGCLCGDCALFRTHDLQDGYYCIAGVAGVTAQ